MFESFIAVDLSALEQLHLQWLTDDMGGCCDCRLVHERVIIPKPSHGRILGMIPFMTHDSIGVLEAIPNETSKQSLAIMVRTPRSAVVSAALCLEDPLEQRIALNRQRLSHANHFQGPTQVSRTTWSREFADPIQVVIESAP